MIKWFLKMLIKFYRFIISPLFPATCRFHPTCSCYALQALERYSLGAALQKILKRILSCHPFHPGGYDPIKE